MLDKVGGRKFLLTLIILIVGTVVQIYSGMNAEYAAFLAGILTAFSATNAYVTTKMQNDSGEPVSAPQAAFDTSELEARIIILESSVEGGIAAGQAAQEQLAYISKTAENAGKVAAAAMAVAQGRK